MAKLPDPPPPEELRRRLAPEMSVLPVGSLLFRIYFVGTAHPSSWDEFRRFGPVGTARFDHHPEPPQSYEELGVLYAATRIKTCVAEVFQDKRAVDARAGEPWLAAFRLSRDALLLSLREDWPTRAGASMNINSGPRPRCRRWSRAIHAAYPEVSGLLYASSMHANRGAVALYERGKGAMPARPEANMPLSHPGLGPDLARFANKLGYDPLLHRTPSPGRGS